MTFDFLKNVFFDEYKGDGKGGAGAAGDKADDKKDPASAAKYTDDQLNDIVAKNSAKAAAKETARLLELAGVKSPEELTALAALKKTGDDKEDPTKKELDELKKSQSAITERADRNEARAEALGAGVKKDALDRVVKLAMSPAYDGTIAERVGKVLAELPEFIDKAGPAFGHEHKDEAQDATQSVLDKARAAAGLPPAKS